VVYLSDIIKKSANFGFEPVRIPNKNLVMLFRCPVCKRTKMIKLRNKPDKRNVVHACTCGHRAMSPGYTANNGTFVCV